MSRPKNIFKLDPSSIDFKENIRNRALKGDSTTPRLYLLKDDTYEPPPHQLVGIFDHGMYLLFGPIAEKHRDSSVLYTKEYKYDPNEGFNNEEGFVVKLIPQSHLKSLPNLSSQDCIQEYHEESKKIRVSKCQNVNVTDVIDSIADQDDIFYIHREHKIKHQSLSSRSQFYDVKKQQIFVNGTKYTGRGSIVFIADTFLDESHAAFFDKEEPLIDEYNVMTGHSKIITILNGKGSVSKRRNRFDGSHGTKVASEAVGNPWLTESGVAPGSKLIFLELEGSEDMIVPYNFVHTMEQAYMLGARSAGISLNMVQGDGEYTYFCYEIDSLEYKYVDFAIVVSAGNNPLHVRSPATAKLLATVGACYGNEMSEYSQMDQSMSYSYRDMASFTSRGPTALGRRVPLLLAPGVRTRGAVSKAIPYPKHLTITAQDGTSFGPSTIVGEYALLEEKYREKSPGIISRLFKNAVLISFAQSPNRVLVEFGDPPENNPEALLKQTYGTPIMRNFDKIDFFSKDYVSYKGVKPLEHQYCLRFDSVETTRVVIAWNDLNTFSGKIAYRLDLHVFSELETRSSSDTTQVYQVVDIKGQTLRVRITSPNRLRFGSSLYYALTMNRTAIEYPCPGTCFPSPDTTNCTHDSGSSKGIHTRYCLHDGNKAPCLPLKCHDKTFGANCGHTVMKGTPSCELNNGHGFLMNDQCMANECEYGYFISNDSSCICFQGSTLFDETNERLGICNDLNSYTYETKITTFDKFTIVSLTSTAAHQQFPHLYFFFILLFIIFIK